MNNNHFAIHQNLQAAQFKMSLQQYYLPNSRLSMMKGAFLFPMWSFTSGSATLTWLGIQLRMHVESCAIVVSFSSANVHVHALYLHRGRFWDRTSLSYSSSCTSKRCITGSRSGCLVCTCRTVVGALALLSYVLAHRMRQWCMYSTIACRI